MTVRVLFCHGLESGPLGRKVVGLREAGFAVTAPDMEMSLFNPARRNSVVRSLLSPGEEAFSRQQQDEANTFGNKKGGVLRGSNRFNRRG